jgi:hypothetical protein
VYPPGMYGGVIAEGLTKKLNWGIGTLVYPLGPKEHS